jgi:uncharacterized DUF497 family protein
VFLGRLALIIEDPGAPENARINGESELQNILLVVFVEQGEDDALRLISARRATRRERRRYEEGE